MTPDEHFLHLAEFIKGVELSGGTTPHVGMTVEAMSRMDDPLEKLWFAGCYALTYNWPTAERIWMEWRPENFEQIDFLMWAEEEWDGIFLRKERKAVYRKTAFAESAASYLAFARLLLDTGGWPDTHEEAFKWFAANCRYMGRYIGIRWLEVMRRTFAPSWEMTDILSDGGEHPRKALALLYPADAPALLGGNSKAEVRIADLAADRCMVDLVVEYDLQTNYYELQSLLCEYKQSILGRKQYPGKSIDTEMDYFKKISGYWPDHERRTMFWDVRAQCFPAWALGEVQGWDGARKELGTVLADHGYTWSDAVHDYSATTDLSAPVFRQGGREAILL